MKPAQALATVVFAVALAVAIVLSSTFLVMNNTVVKYEFSRHNAYRGYPNADAIASNLLDYLKSKEPLNTSHFSEKEVAHLKDVKDLLYMLRTTLLLSVILC